MKRSLVDGAEHSPAHGNFGSTRSRIELELQVKHLDKTSRKQLATAARNVSAAYFSRNAANPGVVIPFGHDELLAEHGISLRVCDTVAAGSLWDGDPPVFVYEIADDGIAEEALEEEENLVAFTQWTMPCTVFRDLWESLVFDSRIKSVLLSYAEAALIFSDVGVDSSVISCNRVLLLHGPPGTGKTSLCHAIAQKLSVRLSERFENGLLVEINAHSLFSKWFSESGKLVTKLFAKITEIVMQPTHFVCVLIDEVESLTAARQANSSEPSDALRVVNSMLTQLDRLKRFPNVLVMATSNMTSAIDSAFLDRADLSVYIGHPTIGARYTILLSAVAEMIRVGLVSCVHESLHSYVALCSMRPDQRSPLSARLLQISEACGDNCSGRRLRKLALLAYAQARSKGLDDNVHVVSANDFFDCLRICATEKQSD